jgi:uncharacterized protein (DUF1778 family)
MATETSLVAKLAGRVTGVVAANVAVIQTAMVLVDSRDVELDSEQAQRLVAALDRVVKAAREASELAEELAAKACHLKVAVVRAVDGRGLGGV